jgi:hypothetical protein
MPETWLSRATLGVVVLLVMNVATGPAEAVPPVAAPTLVGPTGLVPWGSITFIWNSVSDATYYYLHVNDPTA